MATSSIPNPRNLVGGRAGKRVFHAYGDATMLSALLANRFPINEHPIMESALDTAAESGAGAEPASLRLGIEDRMLLAAATGVATYARAVRAAQQILSTSTIVLSGGPNGHPLAPSGGLRGSITRSIRALPGRPRTLRAVDGETYAAPDIFRLAQAHFTIHRRPLPVRIPGPPGVMHWSYPVPIHVAGWRNLYTIHDMIPLTDPDLTPIDPRRHARLLMAIAKVADGLVTVSKSSASDITRHLDYDPGRIFNCSQPVDVPVVPPASQSLPVPLQADRYLLVCGTVEQRKNIARLIEAHARSKTKLPLVLAGPPGWDEDAMGIVPDGERIIRLQYQSRESMIALLANARALLMPSLAEGFGLPVVEAMALGTPVVTSDHGALAETAGDAALLVDARNVSAIADAIGRIDRDEALRESLISAGRQRFTERFTMDGFVARLAALYRTFGA